MASMLVKSEALPPVGYIRLDEAFLRLKLGALGEPPSLDGGYGPTHKTYADQEEILGDDFIANLNGQELAAEIHTEIGEKLSVAYDTFKRTTFPTLLLIHRAIPSGLGGPLSNYAGGIICLQKQGFENWARRKVRDCLIEELRFGRVSLDDARTRAVQIGIQSLEGNPDPIDFNPKRKVHWTLAMAVAWISWRQLEKVREFWNEYRKECFYFHHRKWRVGFDGQIHEGWLIENRPKVTILGLMLDEAFESSKLGSDETHKSRQFFTIQESREDLWRKLQSRELVATGKKKFSERKLIDSFIWQDLEIHGDTENQEYVSPKNDISDNARIIDVTLLASDLMTIWPNKIAEDLGNEMLQHNKINQTPISIATLNEWFEDYKMKNCTMTRDAILTAGRKKFGDRVTVTRLRELYASCAPHGGNKRGRKSANTNSATSELSEMPE